MQVLYENAIYKNTSVRSWDTMEADSILLLNRGDIHGLKRFLKKRRIDEYQIFAKDSVISWFLEQEEIPHKTVSDMISPDEFQRCQKTALKETFSIVNNLKSQLISGDYSQDIQKFVDCFSWEISKKLFSQIYSHYYFKRFLTCANPSQLIIFSDFIFPLSAVKVKKISASSWEPKQHFLRFFNSLGSLLKMLLFLKDSLQSTNPLSPGENIQTNLPRRVAAQGDECILIVGIESKGELKEFLPLINGLISKGNNVAILSIRDLGKDDFGFNVTPEGVSFISIGRKLTEIESCLTPSERFCLDNLFNVIKTSTKELNSVVPENELNFAFQQAFVMYKKALSIIPGIYDTMAISKVIITREYSLLSRLNLSYCEGKRLPTLNIPFSLDQLIYSKIINLSETFLSNIYKPTLTAVASDDMVSELKKVGYGAAINSTGSLKLLNLIEERDLISKKRGSVRCNFFRSLGIPQNARLLIFTTQEHSYSIEYVNLVIFAVLKLRKEEAHKNLYLLVKVHPEESESNYLRSCYGDPDSHILIKQNLSIHEAIESAEVLITFSSYTAIEALAIHKPVLFLRFAHDPILPIDVDGDMITKVFRPNDLYCTLKNILTANKNGAKNKEEQLSEQSGNSVTRLLQCLDDLSVK